MCVCVCARSYDEFGRLKKKYRGGGADAPDRSAREAAALARLRGEDSGGGGGGGGGGGAQVCLNTSVPRCCFSTWPLFAWGGTQEGVEATMHSVGW